MPDTWHPENWSELTHAERVAYRKAHRDEIKAFRKQKVGKVKRVLARAILEAAKYGDTVSGEDKFKIATDLALKGIDEILAFNKIRGDATAQGAGALGESITDWLLYSSPLRDLVESEIQDLYELGFDELRKAAGESVED